MAFTLSVNTNPFVNRFAEPEDLIAVLAEITGRLDAHQRHVTANRPSIPPLR